MSNVMEDTIKQLFNLVWFCKKVSIPFEVYAFTTDYPLVKYDENGKATLRQLSYKKKDGLIQVGEWFSLMNLLTSKVNGKTLEEQSVLLQHSSRSDSFWNSFERISDCFASNSAQIPERKQTSKGSVCCSN
jgi:hypothetical protein